MEEKYLKAWVDWLVRFQKLTDAEFGRLMRAALQYKASGEVVILTGREDMYMDGIKLDIDRDVVKYDARCATSAENGKKGGRPRKSENLDKPNKPKKPNETYPVSGKPKKSQEEDKDKDKEEDKDKDTFTAFAAGDCELWTALSEFAKMRKQIKKPLTDRAAQMICNELQKLAGEDHTLMARILDQSTLHCWQGLYPLKEDDTQSKRYDDESGWSL